MSSLALSVPKSLRVTSLARFVSKPLKVPSLARFVSKPLKCLVLHVLAQASLDPRCRPPASLVVWPARPHRPAIIILILGTRPHMGRGGVSSASRRKTIIPLVLQVLCLALHVLCVVLHVLYPPPLCFLPPLIFTLTFF